MKDKGKWEDVVGDNDSHRKPIFTEDVQWIGLDVIQLVKRRLSQFRLVLNEDGLDSIYDNVLNVIDSAHPTNYKNQMG